MIYRNDYNDRTVKKAFTPLDNNIIQGKRMTSGAVALLGYMLSKPRDWKFYMNELETAFPDFNQKKLQKLVKELETFNHVKRQKVKNEGNNGFHWDWDIYETPYK